MGTFGIRSISTKDVLTNLDTVGFDNLKVTVYGDEAVLLHAGYHPNAKIVDPNAPAETTAAPVETATPVETADPVETDAAPAETNAPAETTAAPAPAEEGGAPIGLIIGIVAAVVVLAAIVAIVLKKKK